MNLSKTIFTLVLILIGFKIIAQTSLVDSLQQVSANHPQDTIRTKALIRLSVEMSRHDPPKVKEYAFQALDLAKKLRRTIDISGSYTVLANYYSNFGKPDSTIYFLSQMKILADQNPENNSIQNNYYNTAGLFYKNKGEFDTALSLLMKGLDYTVGDKYQLNRAGQLLNIGNTYHHQGNLKKAAEYHLDALKLFEVLDNKRGQSFCLQSLGNDYFLLKSYADAKKFFQQSLRLKEELNDERGIITTWNGLGTLHAELGQYKLAEHYYDKALKSSRELSLTLDELRVLFEMGLLYLKMEKYAKAEATFQAGLPIARQRGDSLMTTKFHAQLVNLKGSLKDKEVDNMIVHKIQTAFRAGDRDSEAEAYLELSEWNAKNKNFEKAFELIKKHHQLKDSVMGENTLVQLKQLEERYKQDKNVKEIMLLKKEKQLKEAQIAEQSANQKMMVIVFLSFSIIGLLLLKYYLTISRTRRILAIERVRNSIARDLHDDMGSALSSIQINSQLALKDDTRIQLHLNRIAESASRMMESMGDIVWSINPENDTLEKMVVKMKEFAAEILEPKNIGYTFEIGEELGKIKLSVETRKNLYLIFKESVNNAAKYSDGSAVVIAISLQNNNLNLSVRDNGKGFEAGTVRPGNGLLNMAERARSLQGTLTRQSLPGQGTEILAELPIT